MYAVYIKLHRKLLEWEWYSDTNVKIVFLHCLLMANHDDTKWRGATIERGTFVTSYDKMSRELHISVKALRLALDKLKKTGELAIKGANHGTTIEVVKYEEYQCSDIEKGKQKDTQEDIQTADKGQTRGKQRATNKNEKNEKNEKNIKTYRSLVDEYTPDFDLRTALDDFVSMRKAMKGFTVRALELALSKLDKLAQDDQTKLAIVNQSIERSWKGFFPLKQQSVYTSQRQDVLPEYYEQMKTGSEPEVAEAADFAREEYEEIRRQLREQEEQKK